MGVSNGIVSAPINPQEVYNLLGVGKYNGEYNINYLCSNNHGKINKWAKYKPVKYPGLAPSANYWKAADGFCGFKVPRVDGTNIGALETATWEYSAPTGDDEPFRLLDFEGYDHNARPQYVPQIQKYITKKAGSQVGVLITENFTSGSLLLKEVMARELTDVYVGLMLTNTTNGVTYTYYYSTSQPISAGGNLIIGVAGDNANLTVGRTFKAVLFLCTASLGSSGYLTPWSGANMVWAFPDSPIYDRVGSITIRRAETFEDYLNITSWTSVTTGHSSIKFTVVIKNVSEFSRTFKRKDIRCTYDISRTYNNSAWDRVFKERQLLFGASDDTITYSIEAGQSINFSGETLIDWGGAFPLKWYGSIILELLGSSGKYDALGGYNELSYNM
ncbi:hypothetical protein [uncultured Bacteroides sp.]|uniref:hypothetical protein n=1 Tax=uncultured Bacteroides sp. TaxID=162156 RepID=UPI002626BC80|nr:hypothetical protein [uncultured Bacteroides sp.]